MSKVAVPSSSRGDKIVVRRLGGYFAAEISGVDLRQPLDQGQIAGIRTALVDHEVIVFKGQDINSEQLMAFGQYFGELTVHPFSPSFADHPEVIVLDNHKDNPPALTDIWHSDETFRAEPPMATVLCAKTIPETGGNTNFASMRAAYVGLSARMQAHIEGLLGQHDFKPFRALLSGDKEGREKLRSLEELYPLQDHPVVRVHPESGRRCIFVNPQFVLRIKGLREDESRMLLDYLFHQAERPEYQFRVQWEPGMVVMWDNRSVQHYAVHDYYPQRRTMERVTIKGDRPVGPVDDSLRDASSARNYGGGRDETTGDGPKRQFTRKI